MSNLKSGKGVCFPDIYWQLIPQERGLLEESNTLQQHPAVQTNDPDHPIHPADVQDGRAVRDLITRNYF